MKPFLIALGAAILPIFVVGIYYLTAHNNTTFVNTLIPNSAEKFDSILVFHKNSIISLVGVDGKVRNTLSLNGNLSNYQPSALSQEDLLLQEGSALLMEDSKSSSFTVLTSSGNVMQVPPSLSSLLARFGGTSGNSLSAYITSGTSTLFSLEDASSSALIKLIKVDLEKGTSATLFTADTSGNGQTPPQPSLSLASISKDGKKIYLIAAKNVRIGSTVTNGTALIICDTSTGTFTIKSLPSAVDLAAGTTVSEDGKLVAYVVYGQSSNSTATHIFNVESGKDTTISGVAASLAGTSGIRFSPDSAYIAEFGSGKGLQIISVSENKVTHQFNVEGNNQLLTGFDWTNEDKLIYATNDNGSNSNGNFDPMNEAVHSIDAASGNIFDFPKNLGELDAVLN